MSETLNATFNAQLNAVLASAGNLATGQVTMALNSLLASVFGSGNGSGQINQLFYEQNFLAPSSSRAYDLHAFGGASDGLGNAYSLSAVKLLVIQLIGNALYYYATVATVHSGGGGSGYQVGDVLTWTGAGTTFLAGQVKVTTVSAGAVTGISILSAGAFSTSPSTSANATTGGHGTGCTLDLTFTTAVNQLYSTFTDGDYMDIGNQNDSTTWTSPFAGSGTPISSAVRLKSGTSLTVGTLILQSGGGGFAVVNTTNYKLKLATGSNGANLYYNIIVFGNT